MNAEHFSYEEGKLNNLLLRIQNAFDMGQKQDYEIYVDNLKAVPRTSDPQQFEKHSDFINADSRLVTVAMFKGASRNNEKFFFHIKGVPKKESGLSGIPENMTLAEYDEKQRERFLKEKRFEELEKENGELKTELGEKEKTIDQLTNRLQELHDGKLIGIGEMGSAVLMKLLQHPKVRATFPVLEGLSGSETSNDIPHEHQATFSKKGEKQEENNEQVELSEEEEGYLLLIRDLQARLTPFQLSSVMHILDILTNCPEAIGSTLKHLNNWIEMHKPKKEDEKV